MSIGSFLGEIERGQIVLPAIQRDFVWDEDKIEKLLDSIMRGYPIGIILLWETHNDIDHRKFVLDYRNGLLHTFVDNRQNKRLKLVLDGQQRLQSLFMSIYGTHNGQRFFFDVLSGIQDDDFRENMYIFEFLTTGQADKANKEWIDDAKKVLELEDWEEIGYWVSIFDIIRMNHEERMELENEVTEFFSLPKKVMIRLRRNLGRLVEAITKDEHILSSSIIDRGQARDSRTRMSESDVLEAFFRVNRQGTPLSRSNLIFSLLKLQWRESAQRLPDFTHEINEGNHFGIDEDFVIRCLYAVSGLGTKFDVDILRNKENVEKIKANFERCCNAIRSTIDFVQNQCWISSSRLIRTYNNLIPLVYYLFHTPKHQVPNNQVDNVRKTLYLFGFTSPFSRWVHSRLWKFIRRYLKPRLKKGNYEFPLKESVWWVYHYHRFEKLDAEMLSENVRLTLHLVQRRHADRAKYIGNTPEIDHIFPRSILRNKDFSESEVNHVANFWILASGKNKNKTNRHPKKYFADVSPPNLRRALIDIDMLNYRRYGTFLKNREAKLLKRVREELGLSTDDFNYHALWPDDDI